MRVTASFLPSSPEERSEGIIRLKLSPSDLTALREEVRPAPLALWVVEFSPWNSKTLPQLKLFHKLASNYAGAAGHSLEYAKTELKHFYGVVSPLSADCPPLPRAGRSVEIYGEFEYQVSLGAYTKDELARLIEGAQVACGEAGV